MDLRRWEVGSEVAVLGKSWTGEDLREREAEEEDG